MLELTVRAQVEASDLVHALIANAQAAGAIVMPRFPTIAAVAGAPALNLTGSRVCWPIVVAELQIERCQLLLLLAKLALSARDPVQALPNALVASSLAVRECTVVSPRLVSAADVSVPRPLPSRHRTLYHLLDCPRPLFGRGR